jgi:hypothetical protein
MNKATAQKPLKASHLETNFGQYVQQQHEREQQRQELEIKFLESLVKYMESAYRRLNAIERKVDRLIKTEKP